MAEDKLPTEPELERLKREIEEEPNRYARMFGWYLYWTLVLKKFERRPR